MGVEIDGRIGMAGPRGLFLGVFNDITLAKAQQMRVFVRSLGSVEKKGVLVPPYCGNTGSKALLRRWNFPEVLAERPLLRLMCETSSSLPFHRS